MASGGLREESVWGRSDLPEGLMRSFPRGRNARGLTEGLVRTEERREQGQVTKAHTGHRTDLGFSSSNSQRNSKNRAD